MNATLVYALPSISAIAIKFVFIWYGRNVLRSANAWTWMFLGGLLGVNLFELILFYFASNAGSTGALTTLIFYYVSAVLASAGYFAVSMQLAGRMSALVRGSTLGVAAAGILILMIPDTAVSGARSIGYSVTREAGQFYWILQIVIPGFWLTGLFALGYTVLKSEDWVQQRRGFALLIGSFPLVLSVVIVMALMQLGLEVNATIIVSLAINILLGTLLYTEYESGVFRLLSLVPKTHENRLVLLAARSAYALGAHGLSEAVSNFEKALVNDALNRCKGNKTGAANLLGISRATLRRKMSS